VPSVPGWQFGILFEPASHVGGDVYELAVRPDGRVAVCLADVAGKGVPAALLAASLQTAVRGATERGLTPAELCGEVNRGLTASIPGNRFATFFCGLLDPATGDFCYTNAGHNPPILARASGVIEWLSAGDLVLGVKQDAVYYEHRTQLAEGDCLLVYSDGLVEAANGFGEEFGEARLGALVSAGRHCGPMTLSQQLSAAARDFGGPSPSDDRTAVIVGRSMS
jgi:serine phosphatase RsbU (regulator of sigma subunit)